MPSSPATPSFIRPLPPRPGAKAPWRERAAFWRACFEIHAGSGLNVTDFCRLHHIGKGSFHSWRRTIEAHGHADRASAAAPAFVEVMADEEAMTSAPAMTPELANTIPSTSGVAWLSELARLSAALHAHLSGGAQ